jgi:hypothetical protein
MARTASVRGVGRCYGHCQLEGAFGDSDAHSWGACVNPDCPECDEVMWLEDPADFMYDFFEESPEVAQLQALVDMRVTRMWHCLGCGHFELSEHPPRR